jgi:hypothetical protein
MDLTFPITLNLTNKTTTTIQNTHEENIIYWPIKFSEIVNGVKTNSKTKQN